MNLSGIGGGPAGAGGENGTLRASGGGGAGAIGLDAAGGGALGWNRNGLRVVSVASRFDVSSELSLTGAGPSDGCGDTVLTGVTGRAVGCAGTAGVGDEHAEKPTTTDN